MLPSFKVHALEIIVITSPKNRNHLLPKQNIFFKLDHA